MHTCFYIVNQRDHNEENYVLYTIFDEDPESREGYLALNLIGYYGA